MKFKSKEDIEAPIEFVFEQISDFQSFERSALRRGGDVQRIDGLTDPGPGMMWDIKFRWRGRSRELPIEMTSYQQPEELTVSSRSQAMGGHMIIDLVALSRGRTRMNVEIVLKPKNLTSRLLVQSLKLARKSLMKKFHIRMSDMAKTIEGRYRH